MKTLQSGTSVEGPIEYSSEITSQRNSANIQKVIVFQKEGEQYSPRMLVGTIFSNYVLVDDQEITSKPYLIEDYLVGTVLLMYLDAERKQLFPITDLSLSLSVSPEYSTGVKEAVNSLKQKLAEKTTQLTKVLEKIRAVKDPQQIASILNEINIGNVVPVNLVEKYHHPLYYQIELVNPAAPEIRPMKIRAQVDGGAYTSIIAPDLAVKLNLKPYDQLAIRGALHDSQMVPLCRLNVKLHGKETETKVVILPDVRSRFGGPFAIGQELFNWDLENRGIQLDQFEE